MAKIYQITDAQVREVSKTLGLLNSMVLSHESHSPESTAQVNAARATMSNLPMVGDDAKPEKPAADKQ